MEASEFGAEQVRRLRALARHRDTEAFRKSEQERLASLARQLWEARRTPGFPQAERDRLARALAMELAAGLLSVEWDGLRARVVFPVQEPEELSEEERQFAHHHGWDGRSSIRSLLKRWLRKGTRIPDHLFGDYLGEETVVIEPI